MEANSMNPDQTAPNDYQSTQVDERADNICCEWRKKG